VILDAGLKCILCVGENKQEYELGLNKETCAVQLAKCLTGVSEAELDNVVIAYEPGKKEEKMPF
jgi:triosephosphate isomerase